MEKGTGEKKITSKGHSKHLLCVLEKLMSMSDEEKGIFAGETEKGGKIIELYEQNLELRSSSLPIP